MGDHVGSKEDSVAGTQRENSFAAGEVVAIEPGTARIGIVNYINTAPIYEPWKRRGEEDGWQVHEAPPNVLNKMLASGDLDLGFVSCIEYAQHPWLYRILPGLSISANGPVGSVFFFSKIPIEKLDGEQVLLTSQSDTSVLLTKVVLEEFYGVRPHYIRGEIGDFQGVCSGVLAIGDEALRIARQNEYPCKIDLGEIWKERTGFPFVFAVCAVREDYCLAQPQTLAAISKRLTECREEGLSRLREICMIAAPRIPMEVSECQKYLQGIDYDLDERKCQALEHFFHILIRRGEIESAALPLKIHRCVSLREENDG